MNSSLRPFAAAVAAAISLPRAADESLFESLALDLFRFQWAHNAAYRALAGPAGQPGNVRSWRDIPAVPAAAFKELDLTVLAPAERTTVFHSSGTTGHSPSRHWHSADSLAVYEASVLAWAEPHLRLQVDGLRQFAFLTPPPAAAPRSSLAHMLDTLRKAHPAATAAWFGRVDTAGAWELDAEALAAALTKATAAGRPVALFGTAFNFVHMLDAFAAQDRRLPLPPGSRVMETGGYKGRSRMVPRAELHAALATTFGLPPAAIVTEYGMSELSSQAYDTVAGNAAPRVFRFPPWARARVLSPETGREVAEGETGLLRILDLANVASVLALQTEDLAVRRGDGFELLGRAAASEPRGCSLQAV